MSQRIPILILLLLAGYVSAQDTAGMHRFADPISLGDSVVRVLARSKKAQELLPFFPSRAVFVLTADSVKSGQHRQMIIARYNTSWVRLQRDYKRLKKDMQANRMSFRSATRDTLYYRINDTVTKPLYAYLYQEYKQRKKQYVIRFIGLQLEGHWYLFGNMVLREPD